MSIPYISSGFNPSPPSPPAFQDWESPTPSELVYIQTGNIAPLPVTIPIKIKDVIVVKFTPKCGEMKDLQKTMILMTLIT
jgi:hypothetical protein